MKMKTYRITEKKGGDEDFVDKSDYEQGEET